MNVALTKTDAEFVLAATHAYKRSLQREVQSLADPGDRPVLVNALANLDKVEKMFEKNLRIINKI